MPVYFDPQANKGHIGNGADWLYAFLNSSHISKTHSIVGLRPFDVEPFTRDPRNPRVPSGAPDRHRDRYLRLRRLAA